MTKLNENSKWLLEFINERKPPMVSRTTSVPPNAPLGVGMRTIQGLIRAGLLKESENGFFHLSEKGKEFLENQRSDKKKDDSHTRITFG